jgi:type I restriction enzyme S subunit
VRIFTARREWLTVEGLRLDATTYGIGGLEARDRILSMGVDYESLGDVAALFHAGRFARKYVQDPRHGIPFLSSSDILLADLAGVNNISTKVSSNLDELLIHEGWTLISRSGTVGNTAYARPQMNGMAASEHVLRVAPRNPHFKPGYLFAFLTSARGQALIKQRTYGSVVQHIEPQHIADIPVPLAEPAFQERIHKLVADAATARSESSRLLDEASGYFDTQVGSMPSLHEHAYAVGTDPRSALGLRLDAFHHVGWATEGARLDGVPLSTLASVTRPGIVKRIFVERGVPFVSGIDVYQVRPPFRDRIMRAESEKADSLISTGQILIQRSGQRYGLLGRPACVGRRMDSWAASEHLMRITLHTKEDAGRVFAFFLSDWGRRCLVRTSYGTSIPELNPASLGSVEVPQLPQPLLAGANRALALREEADIDEEQAIREVESWLG